MSGRDTGMTIWSSNTQGHKSDAISKMRQQVSRAEGPAFGLLQEAGAPPKAWGLAPHPDNPRILTGMASGPTSRSSAVYVAVQTAEAKPGKRAPARNNQFVFSNEPFAHVAEIEGGKMGPGLRQPLAVMTSSAAVSTVHEPSGKHAFAASQSGKHWEAFNEWADDNMPLARRRSSAEDMPRAMVGDHNTSELRLRAAVDTHGGGHVISPTWPTQQSGGTLDHGIFSVPATVRAGTAMSGDHTPHRYSTGPTAMDTGD